MAITNKYYNNSTSNDLYDSTSHNRYTTSSHCTNRNL